MKCLWCCSRQTCSTTNPTFATVLCTPSRFLKPPACPVQPLLSLFYVLSPQDQGNAQYIQASVTITLDNSDGRLPLEGGYCVCVCVFAIAMPGPAQCISSRVMPRPK